MGKQTRSARFRPEVDAKLLSVADARGVPINRIIQEAVEEYLGFKTRVSQIEIPERGPAPVTPDVGKTAGQTLVEEVERPALRGPRSPSRRCQCPEPEGRVICLRCNKPR